jgi:hypothetical protein
MDEIVFSSADKLCVPRLLRKRERLFARMKVICWFLSKQPVQLQAVVK